MTAPDLPSSYPISTAPKVYGVTMLLWDRGYSAWCLGYWDGEGWFSEAGPRLDPSHWAPLPAPPLGAPDG
jgi:hypothetical protein